jgi:hypothetical protein
MHGGTAKRKKPTQTRSAVLRLFCQQKLTALAKLWAQVGSSAFVLSVETDSFGKVMGAGWQFCICSVGRNLQL